MTEKDFYMALSRQFFGRDANEAELTAMAGQAERTAKWIAPHPYGRDGGLFNIEPASWDVVMKAVTR
jgi:hypothetical protein